jgi:hypothetical protein
MTLRYPVQLRPTVSGQTDSRMHGSTLGNKNQSLALCFKITGILDLNNLIHTSFKKGPITPTNIKWYVLNTESQLKNALDLQYYNNLIYVVIILCCKMSRVKELFIRCMYLIMTIPFTIFSGLSMSKIFDYNICVHTLTCEDPATSYSLIPIQNLHLLQNLAQTTQIKVIFVLGGSPPSGKTAVCQTLHLSAYVTPL